jgi:hypothetical protein
MSDPYADRMNAVAKLRVQQIQISAQIEDEIAKAWRLAPMSMDLRTFAATLGMLPEDVEALLAARGITA